MKTIDEWKTTLRAALKDAMRARQAATVSVLRETLAAIDNAEAAEVTAAPQVQHGVIAGGVAGLGAGEVARRTLSAEDVKAVLERELKERREAAKTYSGLGQTELAQTLTQQADTLASFL